MVHTVNSYELNKKITKSDSGRGGDINKMKPLEAIGMNVFNTLSYTHYFHPHTCVAVESVRIRSVRASWTNLTSFGREERKKV